jgi:hypothetical protein
MVQIPRRPHLQLPDRPISNHPKFCWSHYWISHFFHKLRPFRRPIRLNHCITTPSAHKNIFHFFHFFQGGGTANVPPPLLNSSHVKMKTNVKSKWPTQKPVVHCWRIPRGVVASPPGLKARNVIARPAGPGTRPPKNHQPCKGATSKAQSTTNLTPSHPAKNHAKKPIIRVEPAGTERKIFPFGRTIRRDEFLLPIMNKPEIIHQPGANSLIPAADHRPIFHLRKHLPISGPQTSTNKNKRENVCTLQRLKACHVIGLTSIIDPAEPGTTK